MRVDPKIAKQQIEKLKQVRLSRDGEKVKARLDRLKQAAQTSENLMPHILEAVKAYATVGEICDTLRDVFGEYQSV
jgi:methylmalonyl-CoA mutase N-terminal domain/subunit